MIGCVDGEKRGWEEMKDRESLRSLHRTHTPSVDLLVGGRICYLRMKFSDFSRISLGKHMYMSLSFMKHFRKLNTNSEVGQDAALACNILER